MGKGDQGKGIKIQPAKDYEKMIKLQLQYLPKQLQAEYANRAMWDPKLIEQAMGTQEKYDPRLAQEQFDALQRRDPQFVQAHQVFGDKVIEALNRGYIDPTRAGAYKALGQQVTGDTLRGATMDPETLRQTTQAILSRSPGLSYGEAQDMAAAVYTGQRGQQLKQQRQQAANQFLGQQSESDLALTAGGRYMGTPGLVQMENQIGGVQAPRSFGYVNPQAGLQGVQLGLQNQQAQLYNQSQSGSSNPWTQALQGAATGANYGSIGGGYGAAGGAITGAVAGAFGYPQYSSERLKRDIVKVGEKNGLDVVEFRYKTPRSALFRGVIAEQVRKLYPHAVGERDGFLTVEYEQIGIPFEKHCSKCGQFKNINDFYLEKRRKGRRISQHASHCKSCAKKASQKWITAHPEKKREVNQRRRPKERAYGRARWRNNPIYKLTCRLRWFLRHHLKGDKKTSRARDLLGCSIEEFKVYLQQKFKDGMAWNNYGEWHIDHIRPCSSFDLLDPEQQRQCFHYTNMQPLWAAENRTKWAKWTESEAP